MHSPLTQHLWGAGLLDKTLSVVFQAWPQAITKALPGRPHQEAALLTPDLGHSHTSQSEGGCTQGPRSCSLLTPFTYFHSKPNSFIPGFLRAGVRSSGPAEASLWGEKGKPGGHLPHSGSVPSTLPLLPLPSPAPHNPRVCKTAGVFCSGLPEQQDNPQVCTDPPDLPPGRSSTGKIKGGELALSPALLLQRVKPWL